MYYKYKSHFTIVLQTPVEDYNRFISIDIEDHGMPSDEGNFNASPISTLLEQNVSIRGNC